MGDPEKIDDPAVAQAIREGIAMRLAEQRAAEMERAMRDSEPEQWQEVHSPTEAVMVRIDGTRLRQMARRRLADSRLFDRLDSDQERAAAWILIAFAAITGPVAVRVQQFHIEPNMPAEQREAFLIDCRDAYVRWGQRCFVKGLSHAAVMDILADGYGAREVDRRRRKRSGWAAENFISALSLFCRLQGWKPARPDDVQPS